MSEENKTLARRVLEEVFNAGNLDVVDEIVSEEHVHHDPAMPEEGHGREPLKEFASMYRSAFPDAPVALPPYLRPRLARPSLCHFALVLHWSRIDVR